MGPTSHPPEWSPWSVLPTGCPCGWPHSQLPPGEVPCGPPESRGEELPHFLSAAGGGRGGDPAQAGLGAQPPELPVPGEGEQLVGRVGATWGAAQLQGATGDHPALPLPQGQCAKVSSINDKNDWKVVRKALTVINFTEDEVEVRPLLGTLFPPVTPRKSQPTFTARIYLDPPSPLKHVTSQSLLHPTTPGCPPVTPLCPCLSPRTC